MSGRPFRQATRVRPAEPSHYNLPVHGYVAVTHQDWFHNLAQRVFWEEVNFWRPSAHHSFNGPPGSPFFFKLKSPLNAIGGFGLVAKFSRLPDWLAWECFGEANGVRRSRRWNVDSTTSELGITLLVRALSHKSGAFCSAPRFSFRERCGFPSPRTGRLETSLTKGMTLMKGKGCASGANAASACRCCGPRSLHFRFQACSRRPLKTLQKRKATTDSVRHGSFVRVSARGRSELRSLMRTAGVCGDG